MTIQLFRPAELDPDGDNRYAVVIDDGDGGIEFYDHAGTMHDVPILNGEHTACENWVELEVPAHVLTRVARCTELAGKELTTAWLLQQVKELVGTVQSLRGQLANVSDTFDAHENQLREVLGAADEGETREDYRDAETSFDAAKRVMDELAQWRSGHRTTVRTPQPGRYVIRVWDNNDSNNVRYGLIDSQTGDWATGNVGDREAAERLARAWNQGER